MERRLTYSDIAWIGAGKWGSKVVTGMLLLSQFCFCIGYNIFLGNTIQVFLPVVNDTISFAALTVAPAMVVNSTTIPSSNLTSVSPADLTSTALPVTNVSASISPNATTSSFRNGVVSSATDPASAVLFEFLTMNSTSEVPYTTTNSSTGVPFTTEFINATIPSISFDSSEEYDGLLYDWGIALLVPIFGTFALLRSIRHLGPGSMIANFTIFFGFVTILCLILSGKHHLLSNQPARQVIS